MAKSYVLQAKEGGKLFFFSFVIYVILHFVLFQETLRELFPSYKNVLKHAKVVAFTCGLMKDPTPLMNHVYEMYIEYVCNWNSNDDTEIVRQLHAEGKHPSDLFRSMYSESTIPLSGRPGNNQNIYWNSMHKGDIDTPSKLYVFNCVREDDVPDVKLKEESDEIPECILWIKNPDAAATKTLMVRCCKISRCQPLKLLIMSDVYCEDWTPAEQLTISKSVQSMAIINCYLDLNFWKNILHQLSDCVNLQILWFGYTNLYQLEEDLDELLDNLDKRDPTNHKVGVHLTVKKFSQKFVTKWRRPCSAIECNFVDSFDDSESSSDEDYFNWLKGEQPNINSHFAEQEENGKQPHATEEIHLSSESINANLITAIVMSEPQYLNRLTLRDCFISDGEAFQTLILQPFCKFLSMLDLSGTNLGFYAKHINDIIKKGQLKELCLSDCQIPPRVCSQVIDTLFACKNITHLNLSGNTMSKCKMELADAIKAWGPRPPLRELDLSQCSLPANFSKRLLLVLRNCYQLINLRLQGNTLTACLSSFLKDPQKGLHSLEKLFLDSTSLNSEDMSHLAQLIEKRKLPILGELDLAANALHTMEDIVENLIETCVTHHLMELKVNVCHNNLSYVFENKCKSLCGGTHIELRSIGHPIEPAWTEVEFLEGFYDDDDDDHDDDDIDNQEREIDDEDEEAKD